MEESIRSLQQEILEFEIQAQADLEAFRLKYTVRKGLIAALFGQLKMVDPADKPRIGQLLNQLKQTADAKLTEAEERLASTESSSKRSIDLTLPGRRSFTGSEHPVQKVLGEMKSIFLDKKVSFADLKATIYSFAKQMFGTDVKLRFRPSFFPFTEPSAEVDVTCYLCGGKGCKVCKKSGWLEIMGCGMVHPNVMRNCGIDPEEWSGYAFGMGVDRTVLLRYKIDDIRLLFENDLRMLRQFGA